MNKIFAFIMILMSALAASAQEQKVPKVDSDGPPPPPAAAISMDKVAAAGVFTGTGYENSILGFSINAPGGFKKMSDEANSAALQDGKNFVNEKNSAQKARELDQSLAKTRVLFQYHGGGASLAAGVERVPIGTTSRLYADANVNILKGVSRAKLSKPPFERTLGGRPFQFFEIEVAHENGGVISQLYMTRVDGPFALFLIASVGDPLMQDSLIQSLNSLKFK